MHQCIKFILFWSDTLRVSDGLSVCFASKQTAVSVWQMPAAVCKFLNAWWWTQRPSETCRVSFQNKINLTPWSVGIFQSTRRPCPTRLEHLSRALKKVQTLLFVYSYLRCRSLTHSLTHSLAHSLTRSLAHSLTLPPIASHTHSLSLLHTHTHTHTRYVFSVSLLFYACNMLCRLHA